MHHKDLTAALNDPAIDQRQHARQRKYRDTDRREVGSEFPVALAKAKEFSRYDTGWIRRAIPVYGLPVVAAAAKALDVDINVMLKAIHAYGPAERFEGGQFPGNTTLRRGNLTYR